MANAKGKGLALNKARYMRPETAAVNPFQKAKATWTACPYLSAIPADERERSKERALLGDKACGILDK